MAHDRDSIKSAGSVTKESTLRTKKGLVIYLAQVARWPLKQELAITKVARRSPGCLALFSADLSLSITGCGQTALCGSYDCKMLSTTTIREFWKKKKKEAFCLPDLEITQHTWSHGVRQREREHAGQKPGVLLLFRSKIP